MLKNLLNVLRKTSFISWVTNDDVPIMYNIKIQDNDNFIIIKGDVETEFDILHNYKIKINKNNLIRFNKNIDSVLTLFCKNYNKELILSY
ncbi:TPA: hypothetical protein PTV74_003293 [Clostridium botulinum]|nr:hypothetical protein [Clostridium botulinum]HDK7206447.1 hypothetical protein [Clostridium botulinum]HDK7210183.1 hypothetical protein [Clostridium botulinum]HDK7265632.1 hypothetical protein [Clostridium botulinum]HDK7269480.1 hypothetical protein [Clostridium botulinum]